MATAAADRTVRLWDLETFSPVGAALPEPGQGGGDVRAGVATAAHNDARTRTAVDAPSSTATSSASTTSGSRAAASLRGEDRVPSAAGGGGASAFPPSSSKRTVFKDSHVRRNFYFWPK